MGTATARSRHWAIASGVVVAMVAALVLVFATRSEGQTVRRSDLNNGGVWVTNATQMQFGRLNKPARQLDMGISGGAAGNGLDVYQDGQALVGFTKGDSSIVPLKGDTGVLDSSASVTVAPRSDTTALQVFDPGAVDMAGGTIALIEPKTGKLRVQQYDRNQTLDGLDGLQLQARPIATVGANAAVAVGVDGSVYAVSADRGVVVTVKRNGSGFDQPQEASLPAKGVKQLQITAVGSSWVVLNPFDKKIYAPGLKAPADLPTQGEVAYAALQSSGPDSDTVAVADAGGIKQVTIREQQGDPKQQLGEVAGLPDASDGQPKVRISRPLVLDGCVHGAWASTVQAYDYYGHTCTGAGPGKVLTIGTTRKGPPVDGVKLRTNHRLIVLNDMDSGDVWDPDRPQAKMDNWDSLQPPPTPKQDNSKPDPNQQDDQNVKQPPKAKDDNLKVRAGRTSVLHVLDNDTDSTGSILAVLPGAVTSPDLEGAQVSPSADGQTIEMTVPEEWEGRTIRFRYTVSNGSTIKSKDATANVSVTVVGDEVRTAPKPRPGAKALAAATYPVVRNGSVRVPVVADWRDDENDSLQIESLTPGVGVRDSGELSVDAGDKPGMRTIKYRVDDGRGMATEGSVNVNVLADTASFVRPITQPDAVRAVQGKPVQVQPLGNDIPGADPTEPEAQLKLASNVRPVGPLTVDTNQTTGTITVTGKSPGTYVLTYSAQTGSGVTAGRVRVDILADPGQDAPPVAAPDRALVRDQTPAVVDVLSNDYSPRSDVVVLQRAQSSDPWLRASIVQGRWVRVEATSTLDSGLVRTGSVSYTISDGTKKATGQVTVVQKSRPKDPVLPALQDDKAIVRNGDSVTIPVLDNDSMAEGIPLKLDPSSVKVITGDGQAFGSGSVVRFIPTNPKVTGDQTAVVEYAAYPEGLRSRSRTARVVITVTPPPGAPNPNQAPVARSFTSSVTAGDTMTITVPTSGVDPDGDLTFVAGIEGQDGGAVPLRLGRVLGYGAGAIRYEAYPNSSGTEVIRYVLRDRFGATSSGYIRVGVVQPGDPQPPVAVEDEIVARPGRTVQVDPLDNDLIGQGGSVTLEDPSRLNDQAAVSQFQRKGETGFAAVVPEEGQQAKVLTYGITDGFFDPSRSTITVRGQANYNNPPVAVDDTPSALPDEKTLLVDVLANDRDLDGPNSQLKITQVVGDGAVIEGRKVRVTLKPEPRVVPYVIEDKDGAKAMAIIYVPAGSNGDPYVIPGKIIELDINGSKTVKISDYVKDPTGKALSLTSPDTMSSSPAQVSQSAKSATEITVSSKDNYSGPGAVVLQVSNATGPNDKSARAAYVSIPVQVGPPAPVLRCPDYEVLLYADGPARDVDIARLCHAWVPTGLDPDKVQYTASWDKQVQRVSLGQKGLGNRVVSVKAQPAAKAGDFGTIKVGAVGAKESPTIKVRVAGSAPPLTVRAAKIDGLVTGQSRNLLMTPYMQSPLSNPQCSITGVRVVGGTGVTATASGCSITVTAADKASKTARVEVSMSDAPGRTAKGMVDVTIHGRPDVPGAVTAVADRDKGGQARVSFTPPGYDGGLPIIDYEVSAGGLTQRCTSSPCTITGLKNGQAYTFKVRARNGVGFSDYSTASTPATPDTRPGAVTVSGVTPGDRTLTVNWTVPTNEGSPIVEYTVKYVNLAGHPGSSGSVKVKGGTSTVLRGLINNDQYAISVQATNGAGPGSFGPAKTAQSVGTPVPMPAPSVSPSAPAPGVDNARVVVSWGPADPNGPDIKSYTLMRRTNGGAWTTVTTVGAGSRSATDTVPFDGKSHEYAVTATNGGDKTSKPATASKPFSAVGIPDAPVLQSASTPNPDKTVSFTYAMGKARGATYASVEWRAGGSSGRTTWCGNTTCSARTSAIGIQPVSLQVRACTTQGKCSPWSNTRGANPFGPTGRITGQSASATDNSITFRWSNPAPNGRPITGIQITGDRNQTLPPGSTSLTIGGLGYSTSKTITIRAIAQDSGPGPSVTVSGKTNAAPPPPPPPDPQVTRVYRSEKIPYDMSGCTVSAGCYWIQYDLANFQGSISCMPWANINGNGVNDGSPATWDNPDDGNNGTIEPKNGTNKSKKYYGIPEAELKVTCTDSATGKTAVGWAKPWGGQ